MRTVRASCKAERVLDTLCGPDKTGVVLHALMTLVLEIDRYGQPEEYAGPWSVVRRTRAGFVGAGAPHSLCGYIPSRAVCAGNDSRGRSRSHAGGARRIWSGDCGERSGAGRVAP
jgi:hypothetical protein